MRFIVFQHGECEHPGIFRQFFREDGVQCDVVELDRGDPIPALEPYDAMLVMGGWLEPWDDCNHPWLADERRAIAQWVRDLEKPFLGVCLGHLLLADALGGKSTPLRPAEIGICEIELTKEGRADPIYTGTASRQKCLQWHSAEVSTLPPGAVTLARSDACACQTLRIGKRAYAMQYHIEIDDETIPNWGKLSDYADALARELGPDGLRQLMDAAAPLMPELHENSRRLYRNFVDIVQGWGLARRCGDAHHSEAGRCRHFRTTGTCCV
jgi:GMP synthase-like glutamine amidotransferase